jgi:hypothetical protein
MIVLALAVCLSLVGCGGSGTGKVFTPKAPASVSR